MQNDRFDAIPIPRKLNDVVNAGIAEGIRQKKRLHRTKTLAHYGAIAAALLIILCAGTLLVSNPAMAAKLPIIGHIFSMVQEKVSYKGDYHKDAEIYGWDNTSQTQDENMTHSSGSGKAASSQDSQNNFLVQTSNGLTVTISESNCTAQALYLALCIENEEAFPADFIKTKNMEDHILDYDLLYLTTNSYYDVPGLTKKDRPAGAGYPTPYYIEGTFTDDHTFTGIIRISLDDDLLSSGHAVNRETAQTDADLIWEDKVEQLPEQFTYYLEISEIYGDLLECEAVQLKDPESGEMLTFHEPIKKHYAGTWNFAIDVTMNKNGSQIIQVNKTNENGVGIASVEKTAFEIKAQIILPEDALPYDYVVVICDADGKRLESQGTNAEVYSTYGRNTDTVYIYVCDYMKYMDELKGNDQKIAEGSLFKTEVHF